MVERCLLCGGEPGAEFDTREMMIGLRHSFIYRRCARCGSLWLATPPDSLSLYYTSYYSMAEDPKGGQPIRGARLWTGALVRLPVSVADRLGGKRGFPRYAKWLAGIPGLTLQSRIADVGSGEGALAFQMSRHGFRDVWASIPLSPATVTWLASICGAGTSPP